MRNCPKSVTNGGTPDESCLNCKCAEYLDNDHKIVTPIDDVSKLSSNIDSSYEKDSSSLTKNGELIKFNKNKTPQNLEDCENVLKVLKKCHHTSFKYIACMVALFMMVGNGTPMLEAVLDGKTLTEYALAEETSKQNVYQKWNRIAKDIPLLMDITSKSKKCKKRIELN